MSNGDIPFREDLTIWPPTDGQDIKDAWSVGCHAQGYPDPRASNLVPLEVESDPVVQRFLALLEDQIRSGAARGFFAAFLDLAYHEPPFNRRNLQAKSFRKS
jgi:hypothetical protein